MVVGTAELAVANLDTMSNEQLISELKKSKEELFKLRFQSATDQLDNHGRLKAVRRDVARIYTILQERELKIRTEPSPVASSRDDGKKASGSKKASTSKKSNEDSDDKEQVKEEA
jgi:large subunit ribosomal protein L29